MMRHLLFLGFAMLLFTTTALGGPLFPSAPPASSYKTLDEVEPRIPIHQSDIPLLISQSGSYYLAENIQGTSAVSQPIQITNTARNVTLDLKGFTLSTNALGHPTGILVSALPDNDQNTSVFIRNGHIRSFRGSAILGFRPNVVVEDLMISNCGNGVAILADGIIVRNCAIYGIGGPSASTGSTILNSTVGIRTGNMSLVEDCVVRDGSMVNDPTQSLHGIWVTPDSVVRNCQVINMITSIGSTGGVIGIRASTHSVVENCNVLNIGSTQFAATGDVRGIWANRSTVRDCIVRDVNNNSSFAVGIETIDASHVVRNRVDGVRSLGSESPTSRGAIGIYGTKGGGIGSAHIEENTVTGVGKLSVAIAPPPEGIRAVTNAAMIRNNVVQVDTITIGIRMLGAVNPALIGNHVRRESGGAASFYILNCTNAYLGANIGTGIFDISTGTVYGTVPAANAF